MRRRIYEDRKTALDSDSTVKAHQLYSDLALIVVHRNDTVIPVLGANKYGVSRIGPIHVDTGLPSLLDTGTNDIDLLTAKNAVLAIMGVQSANTKAGFCYARVMAAGCAAE